MTPAANAVVLETERLTLREMSQDDLDFVASMLADPLVMRYYPKCYTRDEAREWIERQRSRYASHGHGLWIVTEKASGAPVGQVGLVPQHVDGVWEDEVGYLIASAHWRRGLAFEAARACRDYGLVTLGRDRVISLIRPVNEPSVGVARKLGMTPIRATTCWDLEHLVFAVYREGAVRPAQ